MSKAKKLAAHELRSEYKRSDFGALVAGNTSSDSKRTRTCLSLTPKLPTCFRTRRRSTPRCGSWRGLPGAPAPDGVHRAELLAIEMSQ
jgi:hypothetical protein